MNIKKVVLVFWRLCTSKNYRYLRRLKIFDSGYYLSTQGMITDDLDPLWTYVKTAGACANLLATGPSSWSQQADPHPLFDTSFYLLNYFPGGLKENPFIHYLRVGWKKGYRPGPFFDPEIYAERCGWKAGDGDPLSHYCHGGQQQGESPSLHFDFQFYFDKNPILADVNHEIIKHYKLHGAAIGKSPLPLFDPQFYREQLGAEGGLVSDPLSHYLSLPENAEYLPGRLFDPGVYIKECGVQLARKDALIHYVTEGVFAGIYCHKRVASLVSKPLISIVVPVYNPDPAVLRNCIRSVLYQAYPHWQLCLADDCSSRADVRPLLEEWAKKDPRIRVTYLSENGGIAAATNRASQLATGKYISFLDNDDELTVDCLLEVVETINSQHADMVYSDEDLIGDDGSCLSVFRKPGFNRGLLLSHNYITHFVTVKRSLFEEVGGLDSEYDGAQDYDLLLKLSELCEHIVHIPKVLYHWRASKSSTSINHDQKSYANEAGRLALEAAVARRGLPYEVCNTKLNYFYHLAGGADDEAQYTVLIWGVELEKLELDFVTSLVARGVGAKVEYILIAREKKHASFAKVLADSGHENWQIIPHSQDEAKARQLHRLISRAGGEFVVLLDGGIKRLELNWRTELASVFAQEDVAIVCGKISCNGQDGTSYLLPDTGNTTAVYLQEFLCSSTRHMAGLHCPQDVSYAGWNLTMLQREAYLAVGGFACEDFPQVFAMADLCQRLVACGKRIVYTPTAYGDIEVDAVCSSVEESEEIQRERGRFQRLLRKRGVTIDPLYNPGLLAENDIDLDSYVQWQKGDK